MSFVWKTSTFPKTHSWILENDGLERVTPFEDGHCYIVGINLFDFWCFLTLDLQLCVVFGSIYHLYTSYILPIG